MKLLDYIKGNRRGKEAHRTELEAMQDPFLSEALEGFDSVEGDHAEILERLRHRVDARSTDRKRKKAWVWSAAAAVVLCLSVGGFYFSRMQQEPSQENTLAGLTPSGSETVAADSTQAAAGGEVIKQQEEQVPESPVLQELQTLSFSDVTSDESGAVEEVVEDMAIPDMSYARSAPVDAEAPRETIAYKQLAGAAPGIALSERARNVVRGRVVDHHGEPIQGASVVVSGTNQATVTDVYGNFRLEETADGEKASLTASFIGYETTSVTATPDSSPVLIAMHEDSRQLDEVVVAYGVKERSRAEDKSVETPRPPRPINGASDFNKYIRDNLVLQIDSLGNPVRGEVVLEFRVSKKGRPQDVQILQHLTPEADKQAENLLMEGPAWTYSTEKAVVTIVFY